MVTEPHFSRVRDDAATAAVCDLLKQRFDDRFTTGASFREQHGHTTTNLKNQMPDGVVFVKNTQEVSDVVTLCNEHDVPVIAFGTGSSLEGHLNAPFGGISIDLSQMNAVVEVHPEDLNCTVEAGVTRKQLNDYLRDTGLFFPIDPGADASFGGMAATRASGTNAVRYGTMKDNVVSLKAVMPDGKIITTASRAKKSSAGYDLTRLLVGSEGTLGIITEVTLKLSGIPQAIAGGMCGFPDLESACNATIMTIQCGIPIARIELLDVMQIRACNLYSKLDLVERPTLLVEFHGTETGVAEQIELFGEIVADCGGSDFQSASRAEDRTKLWTARHDAYWASHELRPGAKGISTDACVPISRLAECVTQTQQDLEDNGFVATTVGHVGDGNFHVLLLLDPESPAEQEKADAFLSRLAHRAISMGGTCTGEHGVGQGKMKYMLEEFGPALAYMVAIKKAIDPKNIMNPGKMLPNLG
ncbi:FAD-binding oxidoreductase [Cohaesibacter celericrescens]|uniref:D-lactate dehydrogenase (cytochrome) n=1 Tax=Cohaesibacter celericrescens TaxID=2067669 RepID=A0A2N5XWT2_9HYPH|nr:FAD-linked oxidase C-terminal domain-containing protein [Cohaesibacter celericrescens]PLW75532.1 FAD-binding oxidoreductase [Cohaesibacter celericrescens]PLW78939.1 FAD-binding oxidoreductase [Cohaesibacter celericrescens]